VKLAGQDEPRTIPPWTAQVMSGALVP
jgi:hypothetical protein